MKEARAEVNRMQITTTSRFPFIYISKQEKKMLDEFTRSLFEHRMKNTVYFYHTHKQWLNCVSVSSFQKLLFQIKKVFLFFVCFAIYCLFFLRPFCSSCCSVALCLNPPPHPAPPHHASLFLSGFMLQKKGLTHAVCGPSGDWPGHMTEQMLSSNRGPRQQLGFVMRRRERGLLCSAE